MSINTLRFLVVASTVILAPAALSQTPAKMPRVPTGQTIDVAPIAKPPSPPDTELLRNGTAVIYQRDYDAELQRIPENIRGGFGTDINRINSLLQQILVNKTLATEARAAGVDKDVQVQQRIQLEVDKLLTVEMIKRETERYRREFDALPNMDAAARQQYLTQPDKFREPSQYKVTFILYRVPPHNGDEARAMAEAARAKIAAGADMNALARAESEDPKAKTTGGVLDWAPIANWDPSFGRAVERLQKEGDLSPPVKTGYGYQVIRLDGKQPGKTAPYDSVKAGIIEQLRTAYVDGKIADRLNDIRKDPKVVVNQPAVDALVLRVDPELIKRVTHEAAVRSNKARAERAATSPAGADTDADDAPATPAPAPASRAPGK